MIFNQRAIFTGIIFVLSCLFYSLNLLASEGSERIGIGEAGFLEEGQRPPYFEMRKYPFLSRGFFKSIDSDSYFKANLIGKESIIMIFPEKTGTNTDLSLGQFSVQYAKGTFSEMKLKKALMESEVIDRYFFSIAQTPKTFRANQAGARAYSFSGAELDFKIKSKQKAKYFVEVQDKSGPEFSILLREFFF